MKNFIHSLEEAEKSFINNPSTPINFVRGSGYTSVDKECKSYKEAVDFFYEDMNKLFKDIGGIETV